MQKVYFYYLWQWAIDHHVLIKPRHCVEKVEDAYLVGNCVGSGKRIYPIPIFVACCYCEKGYFCWILDPVILCIETELEVSEGGIWYEITGAAFNAC